ncbi:polysaccharide deacetylase family protein [Aureicoccus marinus]|uniref:Polysaccharide deacetylase n=1 Tax=Aureicoccus marinus TaxID=754435 RepID=A0A2S7T5X9_9FLAO|nr:polysaccharide deacetylase family protein [Aureicoccus marinus]PQJ15329.1 polysaccharide deacetylase [Aureicoccus marinus]
MSRLVLILFGVLLLSSNVHSQNSVAITIDDVPNTRLFQKDGYQSRFLQKLDSLQIPVAIFINEHLVYKGDSLSKNFRLLSQWAEKELVTLGNHSYSHQRYSDTDFTEYSTEIDKGEKMSKSLAKKYNKTLKYFRFPYNDLGKDSLQHHQGRSLLKVKGYKIAPFTIESSDWMYNRVYKEFLDQGEFEKAREIGEAYVSKTLEYFDFFEDFARKEYGRTVKHIYLCHDNALNTDYLPLLIQKLKERDYAFISMEEAMTDSIYQQEDRYYKKWGVSWFYRWQKTQKERMTYMRQEPSTKQIMELYESITSQK